MTHGYYPDPAGKKCRICGMARTICLARIEPPPKPTPGAWGSGTKFRGVQATPKRGPGLTPVDPSAILPRTDPDNPLGREKEEDR